jgi:peroxiredoxin
MAIQVGEKLPSGTLKVADANGIRDVSTEQLFGGRKVVLFSVPGAFTPTCSAKHLPGFVQNAAAIRARGIDAIVCLAVNDAFVMGAWGRDQGIRGQRFAMVVEDGVVRKLAVEAPGKFEVSSAEAVLQGL